MNENEIFIEKAKAVHGNKYDYSKVDYKTAKTKVEIICPKHGSFFQKPNDHLSRKGCIECGKEIKSLTTETFVEKAKLIHENKYDYSKVNYKNNKTKVEIICPKHGSFFQKPNDHLLNHGCPICKSSKGETLIRNYLTDNNIKFQEQYTFDDCKNKYKLRFDFAVLNEDNAVECLIEYQGIQHYESVEIFGGEDGFIERVHNDEIKREFCKNNNIKLIELKFNDDIINQMDNAFKVRPDGNRGVNDLLLD